MHTLLQIRQADRRHRTINPQVRRPAQQKRAPQQRNTVRRQSETPQNDRRMEHAGNEKKPSLTQRLSKTLSMNLRSQEPKIVTKTNNGIKMYEDKTDYSRMNDKDASYYSGEVYFASKKPAPVQTATPPNLLNIEALGYRNRYRFRLMNLLT